MGVTRAVLDEAHVGDVVALRVCGLHLPQKLGVDRMTLLLKDVEREGDVGRSHPRPVEEARFRAEAETIVELVGRNADRLRELAIDRIGLVAVRGHQCVEGRRHASRAVALPAIDVEGVERVEILVAARAGDLQRQDSGGRRLRIDVSKMREIRRQGEIPERREAVGLDGIVGERGKRAGEKRGQRAASARLQRRPAGEDYRHRMPQPHRAIDRAPRLITSENGENEAARRRDGGIARMLRNVKEQMG
jgi:hypothetical protein